jgi:hypothetical protein
VRLGGTVAVLTVLALAAPAAGAAGEGWQIAISGGKVFPFYGQTFEYDPGPLASPIVGATLEQRGAFSLDARGGLALNLAVARDLARHLAIEARLDTADVSIRTTGARYRLTANLPAPLPPLATDVDLGTGTVDLERLRPLSLNLKAGVGDRTRLSVSAGASWLPAFRFVVDQAVGIGLPGFIGSRLSLDLGRVALRAEALPSEQGQGRLGFNAGLALTRPIGAHLALLAGGRYFRFQQQTLHWGRSETTGVLPAIQEDLVRQVESRLEPVVFNPTFFHASLGLAFRF